MAVIKRLLAVPVRFGGEVHSGWLPANAATPTPVEDALVDFEVDEVDGGYKAVPDTSGAASSRRDLFLGKCPPDLYTEPRQPGMLLARCQQAARVTNTLSYNRKLTS